MYIVKGSEMLNYRISDMRSKEVINITDGERLGFIYDVLFSAETGRITAVILPGGSKLLGLLGRDEDVMIPWENIRRVSNDVVLVEVEAKKYLKNNLKRG